MRRAIAALFLFGISFGYVEAAVVVYLRAIYNPVRARLHPERGPNDLFPLITPEQLAAAGPENPRRLAIEIGREAATMLMLGAVNATALNSHEAREAVLTRLFLTPAGLSPAGTGVLAPEWLTIVSR